MKIVEIRSSSFLTEVGNLQSSLEGTEGVWHICHEASPPSFLQDTRYGTQGVRPLKRRTNPKSDTGTAFTNGPWSVLTAHSCELTPSALPGQSSHSSEETGCKLVGLEQPRNRRASRRSLALVKPKSRAQKARLAVHRRVGWHQSQPRRRPRRRSLNLIRSRLVRPPMQGLHAHQRTCDDGIKLSIR